MPNFRSRNSVRMPQSQRRKLVWATLDDPLTLAVGAWTNINMLETLTPTNVLGVTVMRTHLKISLAGGVTAGQRLIWGIIVGRFNDIGSSTPGSVRADQSELDWMIWHSDVAAPTFSPGGSNVITLDLKAKRKMQELQQSLILSIFNPSGATVSGRTTGRVLIALP